MGINATKRNQMAETLLRLIVGGSFLWASWDKILDPAGFANVVENYQILPPFLIHPVALILPWVEAICGLFLIIGVWVPGAVFIVNLLMGVFILTFVFNLYRGLDISCGCFSNALHTQQQPYLYILRDLLFLTMGLRLLGYRMQDRRSQRPRF